MRPCLEPGCPHLTACTRCTDHERQRQRQRGTPSQRGYDWAWQKHSRERRAEEPWCSMCGVSVDLTVDHPTDAVLCRPCHDRTEAQRRARASR